MLSDRDIKIAIVMANIRNQLNGFIDSLDNDNQRIMYMVGALDKNQGALDQVSAQQVADIRKFCTEMDKKMQEEAV